MKINKSETVSRTIEQWAAAAPDAEAVLYVARFQHAGPRAGNAAAGLSRIRAAHLGDRFGRARRTRGLPRHGPAMGARGAETMPRGRRAILSQTNGPAAADSPGPVRTAISRA